MENFTSQFNFILGVGTFVGQVVLVGLFILYLTKKENRITKFLSQQALFFIVLLTGTGTFLSLFYSEVLHIAPCSLCWYQRIFIYSSFIIGLLGLWKKDNKILDYISVLTALCLLFGVYHYYIQWGGTALLPCDATALVSPCSDKSILVFHYITIPLMSVTSSLGVLLLSRFHKRYDSTRKHE